jgi:hypothetical protein
MLRANRSRHGCLACFTAHEREWGLGEALSPSKIVAARRAGPALKGECVARYAPKQLLI